MPGMPPNQASMLSTLMAGARAKAASFLRFINDDEDELEIDDDDDDDGEDDDLMLDDWFGLAPPPAATPIINNNHLVPALLRFTRAKVPRMKQYESTWWTRYLAPEVRADLIDHPNGRLHGKFRKLFHISFSVFLVLLEVLKRRWYPNWRDYATCAAGKPVSNIELRLLGSIFYLTADASHYTISTITNISEEVHRRFFLKWIADMNSVKHEYIYMPRNEDDYQHVVGEYTARGLPGCIGSVDCVHIAWDRCPAMYKNMFKGKEGCCSIAYEVVCNCRKFIQSVTVGHPGTRNDKHIVRTDNTVMDLLEGNGWLNSKAWCSTGVNGTRKLHRGVYLICDGGYHRWPVLINPYKDTIPGSAVMKFSGKLESVRKDIEGVFGILKKRFKFLKNFNVLQTQSGIDNAFATCCIIHNIQLEHDGYLDRNLTPLPGGLEEMLAHKFGNLKWNGLEGMWVRDDDDDNDANFVHDPNIHLGRVHSVADKALLARQWKERMEALVDHHQFGGRF
jgi:hypothetical protein